MNDFKSEYYSHIALILFITLYYWLGILWYFLNRKKPSIKARKVRLVLITAIGLFLRDFLVMIQSVIAFSSLDTINPTNSLVCGCVINNLVFSVLQILIYYPIALRFHFLQVISQKITSEAMSGDYKRIKRKANQKIKAVFIVLGVIALFMLVVCIVIAFYKNFRDLVCSCEGKFRIVSHIFNFQGRIVIFVIQILTFIYFTYYLIKYKIKIKYNIKCELLSVSILWIVHRLIFTVLFLLYECKYIDVLNTPSILANYFSYFLDCLMFTLLIYFILIRRLTPNFEPSCNEESLINSFPEALFFWTPNFYFNAFLKKHYPNLVNYRPLIADILRYDFQIEEALRAPSVATSNNTSSHLSSDFQVQLMSSGSVNVNAQDLNPELRHVLKLALYIKERYLTKGQAQFCPFSQNPEVLVDILEKYKFMADNLDQFLFEFTRPFIQSLLSPIYEEFLDSEIFKQLERQIEVGEVFVWMLDLKQV